MRTERYRRIEVGSWLARREKVIEAQAAGRLMAEPRRKECRGGSTEDRPHHRQRPVPADRVQICNQPDQGAASQRDDAIPAVGSDEGAGLGVGGVGDRLRAQRVDLVLHSRCHSGPDQTTDDASHRTPGDHQHSREQRAAQRLTWLRAEG
jgi:hypothetical protein